jgi:hypothetical protein
MSISRQRKRTGAALTPEEQGQAAAVDLLLRVASGPKFYPHAWREESPALQAEFEPLVQTAIDSPEQLYQQEFLARLRELDQGLVIKLSSLMVQGSSKRGVTYRLEYRDRHALLSHALLLLLSEQMPYGKALCRCKLPSCGRFYLASKNPKGGPANRTYCSPAHRDEHHNSYERKTSASTATKHK